MNQSNGSSAVDSVPGKHSGDVCFAGTRVPVRLLFDSLACGNTLSKFLADYPTPTEEQVRAVLAEASDHFEQRYHHTQQHR